MKKLFLTILITPIVLLILLFAGFYVHRYNLSKLKNLPQSKSYVHRNSIISKPCESTVPKSIRFELDCWDSSFENFELDIVHGRLLYSGKFQNEIQLERVLLCEEEPSFLRFVLYDTESKRKYAFIRKNIYRLDNKRKVEVDLKKDNTYKVRFDGDWFFR